MVYNPEFFEKLTPVERAGVLKHEFYHLIFEHVTGRLPPEGLTKMWNVATDLAINSFLVGELPEGGCIPQKAPFEAYPLEQSAEFYFDMLKNDEQFKQDPQDGEGDGEGQGEGQGEGSGSGSGGGLPDSLDDHSGWGEDVDQGMKEVAEQRLKEDLKQIVDEMNSSGKSCGAKTRKQIQDFITPKVDWRKVLRYFIKTSQRANKRSTVRRLNRRFPYIHSGTKVTRQAKIAVAIDQSGSVSDHMLALFFSELSSLSKYASFDIIPFDTEVAEDQIWTWKKGKRHTWERVLTGGTDFNAPTEYVNKKGDYDGLIILTDLEAPRPKPCKCQRMWATTPEHLAQPYFTTSERIIAMEP
jgi:predicted metal-dependent peptidase